MRCAALVAAAGVRGRLSVLIYHRILPEPDDVNRWDVTAAEFERQMRALRESFSPLPLSEALERLAKRSLPRRAVAVTFDDGYADNAEVALPILRRCGVPATFFVATGYLNGGRMWNDSVVEAIRRLPGPTADLRPVGLGVLDIGDSDRRRDAIAGILGRWKYEAATDREARATAVAVLAGLLPMRDLMMRDDQVRCLRAAGMEIGAHTVSHPILARCADADAEREIVDSGRYLAELLREPIPLFAYPNGRPGKDYEARHVAMVRRAGYRAALSTAPGVAVAETDRYQLPRFTPWDRDPGKFSFRLAVNFRKAMPETVAMM
ncbi:MAG: polysaccharide deacetylase family protein [Aromatoleum sp.]|nr:polysaccharide deacetylase family protein [Aromatoleum sp.]